MDNLQAFLSKTFWLALLVVWVAGGCTSTIRPQNTLHALENPVQVRTEAISLTVGRNRWSGKHIQVEELFWPLAVTVRSTATQPLCGGVTTATLSDAIGTSTSAVFPENVASRLIGQLAFHSLPAPFVHAAAFRDTQSVVRQRVGGVWGAYSGLPGSFGPGPFWGGGFSSPFYNPFPSPFYDPWPSPFGRFPYGRYPFPPRFEEKPQPQPEKTKVPLLQELFAMAFTSRPLAPQEERTGFLFFPLPMQDRSAKTLTWDWYDCTTKALVAHLTMPIVSGVAQ